MRGLGSKIIVNGDIARIELSSGLVALIDAIDAESAAQHKWCSYESSGRQYVESFNKGSKLALHRFIMRAVPKAVVDHINCDGLDNRRSNLRLCTYQANAWNTRLSNRNKSGFKGVAVRGAKFSAQGHFNRKQVFLGLFDTAEAAAAAYDDYAREYYGEFARVNFAQEGEQSVFHKKSDTVS